MEHSAGGGSAFGGESWIRFGQWMGFNEKFDKIIKRR